MTFIVPFDQCYKINPITNCWEWQKATLQHGGYGVTTYRCKTRRAHIVSLLRNGIEIPKGYVVHHKCENVICVNPDHLEVCMDAENTRKGKCTKLNESQVSEIRERFKNGETNAEIAPFYGVKQQTIGVIRMGRKWLSPRPRKSFKDQIQGR